MNSMSIHDFNVNFIQQMRPREELWNSTCKFYGSRRADQMWLQLAEQMGVEDWFLRNQWLELCECYANELDGIGHKGFLTTYENTTQWKYTDSMAFLSKAFEHIPLCSLADSNRHQDNVAIDLQCHGPHFDGTVVTGTRPVFALSTMMPSSPFSLKSSSSSSSSYDSQDEMVSAPMNNDTDPGMRRTAKCLQIAATHGGLDKGGQMNAVANEMALPLLLEQAHNDSDEILLLLEEPPQTGHFSFAKLRLKTKQWMVRLQHVTGSVLETFRVCRRKRSEVAGIMMTIDEVDGQAQMVEVQKTMGKDVDVEDEEPQGATSLNYHSHHD